METEHSLELDEGEEEAEEEVEYEEATGFQMRLNKTALDETFDPGEGVEYYESGRSFVSFTTISINKKLNYRENISNFQVRRKREVFHQCRKTSDT